MAERLISSSHSLLVPLPSHNDQRFASSFDLSFSCIFEQLRERLERKYCPDCTSCNSDTSQVAKPIAMAAEYQLDQPFEVASKVLRRAHVSKVSGGSIYGQKRTLALQQLTAVHR